MILPNAQTRKAVVMSLSKRQLRTRRAARAEIKRISENGPYDDKAQEIANSRVIQLYRILETCGAKSHTGRFPIKMGIKL